MHKIAYSNHLLQCMDEALIERLKLSRVELPVRTELERTGELIENLFFIERGIGSMTTQFKNAMNRLSEFPH